MRDRYELESFEEDMLALYEQLRPLYMELHAYVRRKLYNQYGPDVIDLTGPIPSHILGDMWGRFWTNIYRICEPFENGASIDPTDEMIEQGYTTRRMFDMGDGFFRSMGLIVRVGHKMFDMGDGFFRSMGLIGVPDSFFELSMLERPEDGRDVSCHATAWDFLDGKDFRIKMCTEINFDYFLTIHHEMGHIQYFMQYAHQPIVYRDGAHDGFHEAIGEVMSMSVATPSHLYSVGLLENLEDNYETDINFLLLQSFGSVSTLPFHLVNDLWRWKAFRGDYEAGRWNEEFWKLKNEYVGVRPPVPRSSEDLDPPALFHISGDYDMMRYFTRTILQYQFQEKLCQAAGHQGPVYKCDFANSTEAGQILSTMLQLGRSLPWPDALEALTGSRNMDVRPLVNYFQPLYEFLQRTNAANGDVPGWTQDTIRKSLKYEPVAPEQELLQRNSDGL
ncbi:unnamed protein product [Cyprideis torosa]|uniref:Angiotensin-converting enzyme n=1 Tax=Cyprideis torosa TaxID=163714 RepID=A0A7R8ZT76_9CRUS|nr:unnamed protein product [Cyprideis torosa]CAG0897557.1 unnamed protein product [Cyprideis torosa]